MCTSCIVPEGGYPTQDGYIRVLTKLRREGGLLKMRHRLEWEKHHGPIPEGFEINHFCKNRKCCNIEHLECISRSEHRSKDNAQRYKERSDAVYQYHLDNPNALQREIGKLFGLKQSSVSSLLQRYKESTH